MIEIGEELFLVILAALWGDEKARVRALKELSGFPR